MAITNIVLSNEQDTIEVRKALQSLADEISGAGGSTTNNITNAAREVRMILSNNSGAPNTTIDIAAGQVYAQDNESLIVNDSTIQASLSGASANTWYRVFILGGNGVTAQGTITTSATPTLPTGYTLYRRIGWVRTDGSGNILGFTQAGDYFYWKAFQYDRTNAPMPTSRTAVTVTVPQNQSVIGFFTCRFSDPNNPNDWSAYIKGAYFTDVAPSVGIANLGAGLNARGHTTIKELITDGKAYIRANSTNMFLSITTEGWQDLEI